MELIIPQEISNLALWTAVVAFFAPVVLNLIIQTGWSDRAQAATAFLASAVIGVVTAYFSGLFTGVSIVTAILLAFVVTISAYKGFWKQVTPSLKDATTVGMEKDPDGTYRAKHSQ